MKKFLLIAILATVLAVATSARLFAQDTDCPCGIDEEGQCIPCDQ